MEDCQLCALSSFIGCGNTAFHVLLRVLGEAAHGTQYTTLSTTPNIYLRPGHGLHFPLGVVPTDKHDEEQRRDGS